MALTVESFERATKDKINTFRESFQERVASERPDFYPEDLARVKTDDLWMKRFLATQDYDVKLATQMLYDTCQWRKEFGTNELDHTKLLPVMIDKGVLFIHNKDKWGKKLLIFKAKFHSKGVYNMEDIKKFIVYYFERIEREAKSDQISVIFDMKDTGWSNMDMDFIRYFITLLKSYYPWFVNYLMIYEMPWLLKSAWNIIKGWLPPAFVDRVKFVDKKTICQFIDESDQLVEWGGTDEYEYKFLPEVQTNNANSEVKEKKQRISSTSTFSSMEQETPPSPIVSNGRIPPEIKPRNKPSKVKFTGEDGSVDRTNINVTSLERERQPPERSHSRISQIAQETSPDHVQAHELAAIDEVITFTNQSNGIQGTFQIQNLTAQTIIIKVKTTSPEKYRVRPTIGLIEGEARAIINVYVHDGIPIWSLPQDRFQVQVSLVPPGVSIDSNADTESGGSHLSFGDLQTQWKNITDRRDAQVETHRLSCRIDPRISPPGPAKTTGEASPLGSNLVTMNEDDMRRGLSQLEQKLTNSIITKMDERLKRIELLLYATMVFLGLIFIILYFTIPSAVKLPENICTMTDLNHHVRSALLDNILDPSASTDASSCVET